jgi:glycosyltransferase involved in cell wall biosynthesis
MPQPSVPDAISSMRWLILTGEYPPQTGGVSDYTQGVAEGLAARGETVTVFAPNLQSGTARTEKRKGVSIEWLPGRFGWRGRLELSRRLRAAPEGGCLLVQYVPHAFGWRGMNLPLCFWLARQKRHRLWVMFHEVAYPSIPHQPWRHHLLAWVNRVMARTLIDAADRILISTDSWREIFQVLCHREVEAEWAPIPSNFESLATQPERPPEEAPAPSAEIRIGHFGTFGKWITELLEAVVPALLKEFPQARMILIGRGGESFVERLENEGIVAQGRLEATGALEPEEVTARLRLCDFLIQPFPDGVSTRRTSAMAGLALGRPMITVDGHLTESIWRESGAVRLVRGADPQEWVSAARELIESPSRRIQLGERGKELYQARFSLATTLDLLLESKTNSP